MNAFGYCVEHKGDMKLTLNSEMINKEANQSGFPRSNHANEMEKTVNGKTASLRTQNVLLNEIHVQVPRATTPISCWIQTLKNGSNTLQVFKVNLNGFPLPRKRRLFWRDRSWQLGKR